MPKRSKEEKTRRQVVLVIVEGQTDENALLVALTEAFESKYGDSVNVIFTRMKEDGLEGGDITSRFGVVPEKLQMLINKLIVIPCLEDYSLMPKYVTEIVQIIDTDGAFVPKDKVVFKDGIRVAYGQNSILSDDPQSIIARNMRKKANIEKLLTFQTDGFEIQKFYDTSYGNKPTTKKYNVPYSLYFFSCNLDHCICGNPNLEKSMKIRCSDEFARTHANSLEAFTEYLECELNALEGLTYDETWNFIKQDCNSLGKYTNIKLLIEATHKKENVDHLS